VLPLTAQRQMTFVDDFVVFKKRIF